MLLIFFCSKLIGDVLEGFSLRASCFDGGTYPQCQRRLCDWCSSNSVSIVIACNTCMGFDSLEMNGRWWLVDCLGNGLEDISLDVVAVEVWV